jgi:hypothetical protein
LEKVFVVKEIEVKEVAVGVPAGVEEVAYCLRFLSAKHVFSTVLSVSHCFVGLPIRVIIAR